jgi:hypothetical protein
MARNLTFKFTLPVGDDGSVSVDSVGSAKDDRLKLDLSVAIDTSLSDLREVAELISKLTNSVNIVKSEGSS